jgi:hypothetical protein
MEQVALFVTSDAFDPFAFEKVIVGFSGGKDSVACLLHLTLLCGLPRILEENRGRRYSCHVKLSSVSPCTWSAGRLCGAIRLPL